MIVTVRVPVNYPGAYVVQTGRKGEDWISDALFPAVVDGALVFARFPNGQHIVRAYAPGEWETLTTAEGRA